MLDKKEKRKKIEFLMTLRDLTIGTLEELKREYGNKTEYEGMLTLATNKIERTHKNIADILLYYPEQLW